MDFIINSPNIPYCDNVPSSFDTGQEINVDGMISSAGLPFYIGLQCNYENQTDIALEVLVDLSNNVVTINSKQNKVWNEPQTTSILHLQIQLQRKFKFTIQYYLHFYKILINDQEIVDYPQRISCDFVTHLVICGEIQVFQIRYNQSDVLPSAPPPPYGQDQCTNFMYSDSNTNYYAPLRNKKCFTSNTNSQASSRPATSAISLTAAGPNFREVRLTKREWIKKYYVIDIVIILVIIIMLIVALVKGNEYKRHPIPRRNT